MAIRMGDWKLVKTHEGPLGGDPGVPSDLSGAELFNLADDISESRNLAAAQPQKVRELAAAWQQWNRQLARPLWRSGRGGGGGDPHW